MARFRNSLIQWRTPILIWTSSLILFYFTFRIAMDHSAAPSSLDSGSDRREKLYDQMARDLDEKGAVFLRGGETSQSLSLSDIFEVMNGSVTPRLRAADPPVRANVLYLAPEFSLRISQVVKEIFLPYFDRVIWFQNTSLYHFSMFHASHHLTPVPATENEIEAEANAVKAVADSLCPLKIVLDRVVLTSTGVLLGCWQEAMMINLVSFWMDELLLRAHPNPDSNLRTAILGLLSSPFFPRSSFSQSLKVTSGPDPVTIRAKLRNALPSAPAKQLYDPVLLHTSFARLLGHPTVPAEAFQGLQHSGGKRMMTKPSDQLQFFHDLVVQVNHKLHGFQAAVSEIWYVEEYDVLALALNGRMKSRKFRLGCSQN